MGTDADVVRRLSDEVFIEGDVARIDELVGDEFVSHDPPPGFAATKAGFRELAALVGQAFADRKFEFDDCVDTTDGRVVESWAMVGTHTGEFFGLPASGQSVRIRGMEIWRCANGKIVEHWGAVDMSELFAAAGGSPTP
jgi:steroid delta-isomerase-like uncharacterized protein